MIILFNKTLVMKYKNELFLIVHFLFLIFLKINVIIYIENKK